MLKNLALLGVGAAAGYLVAVWKFEKAYYQYQLDSEAAMKDAVAKVVEESEKDEAETSRQWVDQGDGTFALEPGETAEEAVEAAREALTNYQSFSGTPKKTMQAPYTVVELELETVEETDDDDPTKPYVISSNEFGDDEKDYATKTVTWYVLDNVVADETNAKLPESFVGKHIGWGTIAAFAKKDDNYLYVRSDKFETDFEVAKVVGYYSVEIEGHSLPEGDDAA